MDKFKMFSKFSALPFLSNYIRLLHTARIVSCGSNLGLKHEPHSPRTSNMGRPVPFVCENYQDFWVTQTKRREMSSKESSNGDSNKTIEPKSSEKKNSELRTEGIVLKSRRSLKESREANPGHVKFSTRTRVSKRMATVIPMLGNDKKSIGIDLGKNYRNKVEQIVMNEGNPKSVLPPEKVYIEYMEAKNRKDIALQNKPTLQSASNHGHLKTNNDTEQLNSAPDTIRLKTPMQELPNNNGIQDPNTSKMKKISENKEDNTTLSYLNNSPIASANHKATGIRKDLQLGDSDKKIADVVVRKGSRTTDTPNIDSKLSTTHGNAEYKILKSSTPEGTDLPKLKAKKPHLTEKTIESKSQIKPSNSTDIFQDRRLKSAEDKTQIPGQLGENTTTSRPTKVGTRLKNILQHEYNTSSNEIKLIPSHTASVKARIEQSNDELRLQNSKLTLSEPLPRTTISSKTVKKESSGVFKLKTKSSTSKPHLPSDMKSPSPAFAELNGNGKKQVIENSESQALNAKIEKSSQGAKNKPLPKLDTDILQMKQLPRISDNEMKIQTDTPTNIANVPTTVKLPISKNSTTNPSHIKMNQLVGKPKGNSMSQIKNNILAAATEKISQIVATLKIGATKPLDSLLGNAETSPNSSTSQTDVFKTKSIVKSNMKVDRTSTSKPSNFQTSPKTDPISISKSKVSSTTATSGTNPKMTQDRSDTGGKHIIDYKPSTNQCPESKSSALPKNMFGDYMTPEQLKKNREKLKAFHKKDKVTAARPSPKMGEFKSTTITTTKETKSKKFNNPIRNQTKAPDSSEDSTGGGGSREGSVSNFWGTLTVATIYLALSILIYMTEGMLPTNQWQHILNSLKEHTKEGTLIIFPAMFKRESKDLESKQIEVRVVNEEQQGGDITER